MEKKDQNVNAIDIELSEEIAEGIYSNLAVITHSNAEFILDYVRLMPGVPKGKVKARIVMTPQHAKRLLMALNDNIRRFEENFGEITLNDQMNIPMNFGGPTGMA